MHVWGPFLTSWRLLPHSRSVLAVVVSLLLIAALGVYVGSARAAPPGTAPPGAAGDWTEPAGGVDPSDSPVRPIGRVFVAQIVDRGGFCLPGVDCSVETTIYADGTIERRSGADEKTTVRVGEQLTQSLQTLVDRVDFDEWRARPFSGTCPIAYDGAERVYRFITSGGLEELASCEFEIDHDEPTIALTDAMVEAVTHVVAAAPADAPHAGPTDLDHAREALLRFFALLGAGDFEEAATLYGGSYDVLQMWNPDLDPYDHAGLWANACTYNGLQCLPIRQVVLEHALSPVQSIFVVEFMAGDGSLFERGPCCGETEENMPTQSRWLYTVHKYDGRFLVHELPVYVP